MRLVNMKKLKLGDRVSIDGEAGTVDQIGTKGVWIRFSDDRTPFIRWADARKIKMEDADAA